MKLIGKSFVIFLFAVFVFAGCSSDDDDSSGSTGSTGITGLTGLTGTTGTTGTTGSTQDTGTIGIVQGDGTPMSIQFLSATPENIALKGTGSSGRPETSLVVFQVLDEEGGYLPGVEVDFSFLTNVGGMTLEPSTATTDSNGQVGTFVTSGNVATTVRVIATVTIDLNELTGLSTSLVVSTGIADQNSFSIALDKWSIEGWARDNVEANVMVMAADHFNNPVPDGTAIYFTTEGGAIEPYCLTANGICSVTWRSQNPRPLGDAVEPRDGRATIMATTMGEESFVDAGGDGVYNASDASVWDAATNDLPEAFLDVNWDDSFDLAYNEEFNDLNVNGSYDIGNGIYNGVLCTAAAETSGYCTSDSVEVRRYHQIVMATDDFYMSSTTAGSSITFTLQDRHGNSLPTGSSVSVSACSTATLVGISSDEILESWEPNVIVAAFEAGDTPCGKLEITTPLGFKSVWTF